MLSDTDLGGSGAVEERDHVMTARSQNLPNLRCRRSGCHFQPVNPDAGDGSAR